MKIARVKKRSVLFTYSIPGEWNLNLQLILGDRYNYLVDTGLGSVSVAPALDYLRRDRKPIIVINTHYHWDHVWGNSSLRGCIITAHKLGRDILETDWEHARLRNGKFAAGEAEKCLPNLTFERELYFAEDRVRIMHTPGHTVDSVSMLDEADKVLNAGDNIGDTVEAMVPELDCEKEVYRETLLKYGAMDFDACVSGHNAVLGKPAVESILEMI